MAVQSVLTLRELVETVRQELEQLYDQRPQKGVLFQATAVELETEVYAEQGCTGEGELSAWVLKVKGGADSLGHTGHKVKITLAVRRRNPDGSWESEDDLAFGG